MTKISKLLLAAIFISSNMAVMERLEAKQLVAPPMTLIAKKNNDNDPYPPGCVNTTSFDACAIHGRGCDLGSRRACREICEGLCND